MFSEIMTISPRARAEARFLLRVIDSDPQPAVAKIGRIWAAWDGRSRVVPFRGWKGAVRHAAQAGYEQHIRRVVHETLSGMPDYNTIKENP